MLALAAVVVLAGSQLVAVAGPRSTARAPARCAPTRAAPSHGTATSAAPSRGATTHVANLQGGPRHWPDQEGQRNAQLGCALCFAVADWLNNSLVEAHEQKKRLTAAELSVVLDDACKSGFEGYQLWPPPLKEETENKLAKSREEVRHLSQPAPPANWMERLRKECRWYVQEAGEEELYRQWRGMLEFEPQRLDLFLCKNSGWLRACVNLSDEELPSLHPPIVGSPPVGAIVANEAAKMATYSITRFRIICTRLFCWQF